MFKGENPSRVHGKGGGSHRSTAVDFCGKGLTDRLPIGWEMPGAGEGLEATD